MVKETLTRAIRALHAVGLDGRDVQYLSDADLLRVTGIGKATLAALREAFGGATDGRTYHDCIANQRSKS